MDGFSDPSKKSNSWFSGGCCMLSSVEAWPRAWPHLFGLGGVKP